MQPGLSPLASAGGFTRTLGLAAHPEGNMPSRRSALVFATWCIPAAGGSIMKSDLRSADLLEQVRQSELAFTATMSARDLRAFAGFIAEDAVFIN